MLETLDDRAVEVQLTFDEYMKAIINGVKRSISYIEEGRGTPRGGKGMPRVMVEGAIAEMMVAKHFDVEFDDSIVPWDDGADLQIDGYHVDVKQNTWEEPKLLIKRKKLHGSKVDYYILVYIEDKVQVPVKGKIIGYKSKEWIKENITPKRWPLDILNYRLDWRGTNNITEFKDD